MRKSNMQKSKKQKLNTNRGITLISLVITIIVMLILVAVTISMAVNGGLFEYAGNAVGDTQNAIDKEQELADGQVTIDNKVYNSIDEYVYGGTTLVSLYKKGELKVGDYVDYNPAGVASVNPDNPENKQNVTVGALTGYTTAAQSIAYEDLSWRVLGYDEAKNELLLISATPTNAAINFYGHIGYNNYENVLNTTCSKLYSNTSIGATARSITMNDIDTYLGGSAFDKTTYGGGTNTPSGYGYRNSNISSKFSVNTSTGKLEPVANNGTVTLDLTGNAYKYKASEKITDAKQLDLVQGSNASNYYYYWVASRAVGVYEDLASWHMDMFYVGYVGANVYFGLSDGREGGGSLCIRPVISLTSKVTTNDVPVLETAPTLSWDDPLGKYSGT